MTDNICPVCGKAFEKNIHNQQYCSVKCRNIAKKDRLSDRKREQDKFDAERRKENREKQRSAIEKHNAELRQRKLAELRASAQDGDLLAALKIAFFDYGMRSEEYLLAFQEYHLANENEAYVGDVSVQEFNFVDKAMDLLSVPDNNVSFKYERNLRKMEMGK